MLKLLPLILALSTNASALSYTSHFNLAKPTTGDTNYVTPFNVGMDTIDTQLYDLQVATSTLLLPLTGGTLTGPLTLAGSSLTVNGANVLMPDDSVGIGFKLTQDNASTVGYGFSMDNSATGDLYLHGGNPVSVASPKLITFARSDGDVSIPLTPSGSAFSVGTSTFVVTGGNIGIGMAAPTNLLEINAPAAVYNRALVQSMGSFTDKIFFGGHATADGAISYYGVNAYSDAAGTNSVYNSAHAAWKISTDARASQDRFTISRAAPSGSLIELFRISSAGSVGIGTTTPASKVDISSGTIRMAGTGAPTVGFALCLTANGEMGHCTAVTAADGSCTCVTP